MVNDIYEKPVNRNCEHAWEDAGRDQDLNREVLHCTKCGRLEYKQNVEHQMRHARRIIPANG